MQIKQRQLIDQILEEGRGDHDSPLTPIGPAPRSGYSHESFVIQVKGQERDLATFESVGQ